MSSRIWIRWEWWPDPIGGTQDDPRSQKRVVGNVEEAEKLKHKIHRHFGNSLRHIDVTVRVFENKYNHPEWGR